MNQQFVDGTTRREFLKHTGRIAAAATIVSATARHVHAAEDNTIQLALVGCGGRGIGAAGDALSVQNGPIKLVALADVIAPHVANGFGHLSGRFGGKVDVPEDRRFVGFDGYQKAMDCLRPGDVVILGTPPVFRWVHFKYAMDKGLNVFMEKPVSVDAPTSVKMFELAKESVKRNQKVGVGLMCRHCRARGEMFQRIKDGEIGDLTALRAYRMAGPTASAFSKRQPADELSELIWQIKRFHSFLWLSGGAVSDFLIHNIDECCWMKNAWPVSAQASGGRHFRHHTTPKEKGEDVDQNFDNYSVEYTFDDGAKLLLYGRTMAGCHDQFASYAHGSKGVGVISTSSHSPARCRIYKGQKFTASSRSRARTDRNQQLPPEENLLWSYPQPEPNPYDLEWEDLIRAIRQDQPYSEVERGAKASLVTSMGRMAAHTGQIITYDDILNCEHEFAPTVDQLTFAGSAPLTADANGRYPIPMPGIITDREYA
jgi:predicted dehydrogenase